MNRSRIWVVALSVLIGIAGASSARALPPKGAKALAKQTAQENARGEEMKKQALASYSLVENTPYNEVMKRVFDRLVAVPEVAARKFDYEIFLVRSDEANAYCTPGGKIFVLSGMTSLIGQDENLWAALLGHELAHGVRSHGFTQEKKAKGIGFLGKFLNTVGGLAPGLGQSANLAKAADVAEKAGKVAKVVSAVSPFVQLKFSRDDEKDADAQGMLYMATAGFDPQGAIRLHTEIMDRFGDSPALATFLKTHPREAVRIERLKSFLPVVTGLVASSRPGETQEVLVEAQN